MGVLTELPEQSGWSSSSLYQFRFEGGPAASAGKENNAMAELAVMLV